VRRTLPPLNPIRSFEAAARHLSYTLAAQELSVTQVAVSRQVHVLEEYLEVALFERGARSLRLTDAGRALLPTLTQALNLIEDGISHINKHGKRNLISLQVYTAFAQRWLIPRLPRFRDLFPQIDINLRASDQPLSFERQNIDAAIISCAVPPTELDHVLLASRDLLAVCSPVYLKGRRSWKPEDLRKMTLLHSLARPEAWREWLEGAGLEGVDPTSGLRFETSSMVLGAAAAGMGVAMTSRMLVEDELRTGALVIPFQYVHPSPRKYYFVMPKTTVPSSVLVTFREWLINELVAAGPTP
jgi:LysR family glycine cleavage system transcriptional activator